MNERATRNCCRRAHNASGRWPSFDRHKIRGTVRVVADVPVAISAQRVTRNLRQEQIRSEMAFVDVAALEALETSGGAREIELPDVSEGAGVATEIVFVNPRPTDISARVAFSSTTGAPAQVILR